MVLCAVDVGCEVWESPVLNCQARNPAALPQELGGVSSRWLGMLLSLLHCDLKLGILASFRSVRPRAI